jgi:WD40 repeat protein
LSLNIIVINNINIASGNVFGKVTIWKVNNNNNEHNIINTLIGHEGVIFNIKWNNNNKIATVSDDRSIRIWDSITGNPIFIGWGHICRPWDSLFINNINNKELIATSSEEGTIKIWDINEKKCICNLRGHSSDIWRLSYINKFKSNARIQAYHLLASK